MKPTSEQTRRGVLSAIPFLPEEQSVGTGPSPAYGCVDWYLYPDSADQLKSGGAVLPGSTTPNLTGKQA